MPFSVGDPDRSAACDRAPAYVRLVGRDDVGAFESVEARLAGLKC